MTSEGRRVGRGSLQRFRARRPGERLLGIGALALIVPASVRSSEPIIDPENLLRVSLGSDAQIHLSPGIHVSLETDDDWTRLKSRAAIAVANAYLQSVTGPAQIRQDGAWTWLEVSDGKNHFKSSWVRPKVQLVPGRTYTFVVFSHPHWEASVEKIFENGVVIYDMSVCEAHGIEMDREEVPVIYGRVSLRKHYPSAHCPEPPFDSRMQLFPHYIEVTYGGCVDFGERTAMLYACPKCRAEFIQWEQQHTVQSVGHFPNLNPVDNLNVCPVDNLPAQTVVVFPR